MKKFDIIYEEIMGELTNESKKVQHYIEIDWADDENSYAEFAKKFDATAELIDKEGPGGKHPLIKFIGTKAALEKLVKAYDEDNAPAIEIKPVG